MLKRTLGIFFIFFILSSNMGYAQDATKAYSWNDDQLFSYVQKFSELKRESDRTNPKRIQGVQSVIEEMGRRGLQRGQDTAWNKKAVAAMSLLNSSLGDNSLLHIKLSSPMHDTVKKITWNITRNISQFGEEEKTPLIQYYAQYGKQSERRSHEVLESTKALTSLGDRLGAAHMLERYSEHHDIASNRQAQSVVGAIKEDPRLLEIAKLAIVEGEKGKTASPLEYDLFEYTKSANSDDKKLLAPIWQDALLTTKKPANQYLWADFLVKQGDIDSLKTVFSTRFLEPDQARTLQKQALENMDPMSLVALTQKDPMVLTRGEGVAAAPGDRPELLTADQFQLLSQHLLGMDNKVAARMAAQKSLQASPQEGTNYSNFPSLGLLIDLAHEGDRTAQVILMQQSFLSPQSTLNDRDRVFTLQEMSRTRDSRFQPFLEEGLKNSSPDVREAGLQGLGSLLGFPQAYERVLWKKTLNSELRKKAFDGLIEEREKADNKRTFDAIYKPVLKALLHDSSSDSLRVKALSYFKDQNDTSIVKDLNQEVYTIAQEAKEHPEVLSCEKESFSYQLPSALISLSSADDATAADNLVWLFKAGVMKQTSNNSCPVDSKADFDAWLETIEKGFKHFNNNIQAYMGLQLEKASQSEIFDKATRERFKLAAKNLKPKEEVAETCPVKTPEEMIEMKVPKALSQDIQKLVDEYLKKQNISTIEETK